jgi:hypothetical protein
LCGETSGHRSTARQTELAEASAALAFNSRPGASESTRERIAAITIALLRQLRAFIAIASRDIAAAASGPPATCGGVRQPASGTAPSVLMRTHRAILTAPISYRNLNDTFTVLYQTALLR